MENNGIKEYIYIQGEEEEIKGMTSGQNQVCVLQK